MMTVDVLVETMISRAPEVVSMYAGDPANATEWYANIRSVHGSWGDAASWARVAPLFTLRLAATPTRTGARHRCARAAHATHPEDFVRVTTPVVLGRQ